MNDTALRVLASAALFWSCSTNYDNPTADSSTGGASTSSGGSLSANGGTTSAMGGSASGGSPGGAPTGAGGQASGSDSGGADSGGAASIGIPKNPVLTGFTADPQIASFHGKFYIYPTSDGFDDWMSTQFHAFSSSNLVEWRDEGVILDLGPGVSWANDRAWAPGIAEKNGTYYFYFSAALAIGVATSKSPVGPFSDALGHPLVTKGQYGGQSIDPYVFEDDDGRHYLYFGSGSQAHVVELKDDMISFEGAPQTIKVAGFREGSVVFRRNGVYYFMYSVDDTRSENYNVAYGMGSSPFGPFSKPAANPILRKDVARGILGTGHHSVLRLDNGDYFIAYHRFAIPDGDGTHREVCLDRLEFNDDGTIAAVVPTP